MKRKNIILIFIKGASTDSGLFCCILHPLSLPLFAVWLIGSVLTVPLEYAYVRLTGPWWSSYALRRS